MNTKTVFKVFLDIFMTIIFLLLINFKITGLLFHEIVGIGLLIFIILHNILNIHFILNVTKRIFDKNSKINKKQIFMYILNIMLTLGMITIIISGICISKYIFKDISFGNRSIMIKIHKISSYIELLLIFLHIGIHFKYMINSVTKIFKGFKADKIKKGILLSFAFLFISIILYLPISNFLNKSNSKSIKDSDGEQIYEKSVDTMTLDEFLSSLTCTGCNKHCLLISPGCSIGEVQKESATEKFNSGNTDDETLQDNNNDSNNTIPNNIERKDKQKRHN